MRRGPQIDGSSEIPPPAEALPCQEGLMPPAQAIVARGTVHEVPSCVPM